MTCCYPTHTSYIPPRPDSLFLPPSFIALSKTISQETSTVYVKCVKSTMNFFFLSASVSHSFVDNRINTSIIIEIYCHINHFQLFLISFCLFFFLENHLTQKLFLLSLYMTHNILGVKSRGKIFSYKLI